MDNCKRTEGLISKRLASCVKDTRCTAFAAKLNLNALIKGQPGPSTLNQMAQRYFKVRFDCFSINQSKKQIFFKDTQCFNQTHTYTRTHTPFSAQQTKLTIFSATFHLTDEIRCNHKDTFIPPNQCTFPLLPASVTRLLALQQVQLYSLQFGLSIVCNPLIQDNESTAAACVNVNMHLHTQEFFTLPEFATSALDRLATVVQSSHCSLCLSPHTDVWLSRRLVQYCSQQLELIPSSLHPCSR